MSHKGIVVNEVYGPVPQGEGKRLGQPSIFLRTGGCNLSCTWCDSAYTWDSTRYNLKEENTRRQEEAVAEEIHRLLRGHILPRAEIANMGLVITGGEPMLQQSALQRLHDVIEINEPALGRLLWSLETAGTLPFVELDPAVFSIVTVSPKLAHSGNNPMKAVRYDILKQYMHLVPRHKLVFKFVCKEPADILEVAEWQKEVGFYDDQVYIMPEGVTAEAVISHSKALEQTTMEFNYNLTTRLHVLMHDDERAV